MCEKVNKLLVYDIC